jgi:hypothetical protein
MSFAGRAKQAEVLAGLGIGAENFLSVNRADKNAKLSFRSKRTPTTLQRSSCGALTELLRSSNGALTEL